MKRTKKTFTATEQQLDDMLFVLETQVDYLAAELVKIGIRLRRASHSLKQIRSEIRNRRKP